MRFGASIWPWKWDEPYDGAIRRIGRAGFRAVELIAWDDASFTDYYTDSTVRNLRAILDGEGMELSQFVVKTPDLSSGDPAKRAHSVDLFKRGVEKTVALGSPIINTVVHYPFNLDFPALMDRPHMQTFSRQLPTGLDWERNWHDYIAALSECASAAEDAGIRYSLEPHPFRYGANTEGLLRILEAVDSPALGVNFDPSHTFAVGDFPNVTAYRLGDRVFHCHFSDNDGETNVHWRPGMGKIDWRELMQAFADTGFDGVISLEFEDIPGVSRGTRDDHGAYKGNVEATAGFETEYRTALTYLTGLAIDAGLTVE
ncbi:MAG: Sugar phosphate isomerase/epimerase [Subtercola sp.]|nr:Sugar phosphate isomerase/epimerase [Subtercola sp.]